MSERLRPRDLAFLELETPTTPRHNATVEVFDPGDSGLRLRPVRGADPRPDPVRAALPPARAGGARPPRQPGLGRRRALRHRLPRTPFRAAPPRQHRAAARAGLADRLASPRPGPAAVGDLLRRGAGRRPGRAALQDPPGARRRRRDRRPRPGAARQGPRGEDPRRRRVAPAPAPLERRAGGQRPARQPHRARHGARHGPARRRLGAADRGPAHLGRGQGARRADRPPSRPRQRALRRALPAAPGRRRRDHGSPTTAPSATRTAAPSTTSSWPPSPVRCGPG